MNNRFCNICIKRNTLACKDCLQKGENLNFVPHSEFRPMFDYHSSWHNGNTNIYSFNCNNTKSVQTRVIEIDGDMYCPYCGNKALVLYSDHFDYGGLRGYCCLCDQALAEIEFQKELNRLNDEHEKKLYELQLAWKDKLKYNSRKLFDIQQRNREERFKTVDDVSYFTTINGKTPETIERLFELD